jgi:hypothetical protein
MDNAPAPVPAAHTSISRHNSYSLKARTCGAQLLKWKRVGAVAQRLRAPGSVLEGGEVPAVERARPNPAEFWCLYQSLVT